ncbi:autotransporter domain-containing protein [Neisseria shayeganii]|uniref:Lipase/esterase n=1 Tax=Neisseria shayeganii 871 TaxID=1032488 RepID=G4CFS0_9NEIS|nr:autotransporter domain-containing protein [Neisseria shayeganii]EGY53336.1 lipase/esterase [Neisseria shayeganii 871]
MKMKWMALMLAAYTPLALAQEVVIFGDSLSDVGQKGWADHPTNLHLKASYLKADGSENLLYGEHVAQALGGNPKAAFPLDAAAAPGTNYAHSGGVVVGTNASGSNLPDSNQRVAIDTQIDAYLASGKVNANNLHILWGGGNDMAAILTDAADKLANPAEAQALVLQRTAEAAATSGAQWQRLRAAGVDLVVAPDVPNVLYTPEIQDQYTAAFKTTLSQQVYDTLASSIWTAWGAPRVKRDIESKISAAYNKRLKEANLSGQNNLEDFKQARLAILEQVADDFWAAESVYPVYASYGTYGEMLAAQGYTPESFKDQLTGKYVEFGAAATQATDLLNAQTTQALNQQGGNVVRLAVNQLFTDMLSDPAKYGFSNTLGRACNQATASVLCGEGLSSANTQAANANPDNLLFADSFHPGPKAHRIMADYLLSTLRAPVDMGGLSETARQNGEAAWDFVREDSNRLRGVQTGRTLDAVAAYQHSSNDAGGHTVYAGGKARLNPNWQLGVVFSRQEQDRQFGHTRINAKTNSLTSTLRYDAPQWWLGGMVQLNDSDYQTRRSIRLGQADLTQTGETGGTSFGAGVFGGYEWQWGQTKVAALGDLMLLSGKVKGFGERDGGATQMQFGKQSYTSVRSGLGGQAAHRMGDWQPYANLRWVRDWKNHQDPIEAGMNGSRFSLAAPQADRSWLSTRLGVQWQPQNSPWRAFGQLGRDFGRDGGGTSVQLGVGARF